MLMHCLFAIPLLIIANCGEDEPSCLYPGPPQCPQAKFVFRPRIVVAAIMLFPAIALAEPGRSDGFDLLLRHAKILLSPVDYHRSTIERVIVESRTAYIWELKDRLEAARESLASLGSKEKTTKSSVALEISRPEPAAALQAKKTGSRSAGACVL